MARTITRVGTRAKGDAQRLLLTDLPLELILEIISHAAPPPPLPPFPHAKTGTPLHNVSADAQRQSSPSFRSSFVERRRTLGRMCLVDHGWADVARTVLYRDVFLESTWALYAFLRTLATKPNLRGLVHSLTWMGRLEGVEGLPGINADEWTRPLEYLDYLALEVKIALADGDEEGRAICTALDWKRPNLPKRKPTAGGEDAKGGEKRKDKRTRKMVAKSSTEAKEQKSSMLNPHQSPFTQTRSDKVWHVDAFVALISLIKGLKSLTVVLASNSGSLGQVDDWRKVAASYRPHFPLSFLSELESLALDIPVDSVCRIGEVILDRVSCGGLYLEEGNEDASSSPQRAATVQTLRRLSLRGHVRLGLKDEEKNEVKSPVIMESVTELVHRCENRRNSLRELSGSFPGLRTLVLELRHAPLPNYFYTLEATLREVVPHVRNDGGGLKLWHHLEDLTVVTNSVWRSQLLRERNLYSIFTERAISVVMQAYPRVIFPGGIAGVSEAPLKNLTIDCATLLGPVWETGHIMFNKPEEVVATIPADLERLHLVDDLDPPRADPDKQFGAAYRPCALYCGVAQFMGTDAHYFATQIIEKLPSTCEGSLTVEGGPDDCDLWFRT